MAYSTFERKIIQMALLLRTVSILLFAVIAAPLMAAENETGFTPLMDGKTFDNWKIAEPERKSWTIEDGAFVARGDRSHLFYMPKDEKPFVNFELKVDVKTTSGSNGGIFIHTAWQESNWPKAGYEIQVNQTHSDWRKSGSIYAVNDVKETHVKDGEWYTNHIIVQGKRIIVKLNDKVVNDWTEEPDRKPGPDFTRILSSGTFALQAHDPKSVVHYRDVRVKRLD